MKIFIYFFILILSINCQEESILVNARYFPKSNTLEFNGQKYIVNTSLLNENLEPISPKKIIEQFLLVVHFGLILLFS